MQGVREEDCREDQAKAGIVKMKQWRCKVCGYDAAEEGIPFEELPDDWYAPSAAQAKLSSRRRIRTSRIV